MVIFGHHMCTEVAQKLLDCLSKFADEMQVSIAISKQRLQADDPASLFEVIILYQNGEMVLTSPTFGSVDVSQTEMTREQLCVIRGSVRVFRTELEVALRSIQREDSICAYHRKMIDCPA